MMESTKWPRLGEEELQALNQILTDGDISTHGVIRELETDYSRFTGRDFALAHNNGTSALMAAFYALDLKPGDEILVPTGTFWASVLPMLWFGLVPVFCNCEADTLGLDVADLRQRITPRTRALVMVHLWGLPCNWGGLKALAEEFDLKVIEDASHAHGAKWNDQPCGSLGDISVFSLQGDKLAPAGEGGLFLTDNEQYMERAILLGDITRIIELPTPAARFAATSFGMKTRIAPLSAALARVSLRKLSEQNRIRSANAVELSSSLEELGFDCFSPGSDVERVYFEFLLRSRDLDCDVPELIRELRALGCDASHPRYPLLHQQPFFTEGHHVAIGRFPADTVLAKTTPGEFEVSERENERLLRLPIFTSPAPEDIERIVSAFRQVLGH